jgi:hypothetical protein
MPRTTLDIDAPILRDLKALQRKEGKSLGRVVSDLLAEALTRRLEEPAPRPFAWEAGPMGARVDLEDKEAVRAILDETGDRR